jgi:hypothetical protein
MIRPRVGLCECGCGRKTTIFRNKPRRFIKQHHFIGKYLPRTGLKYTPTVVPTIAEVAWAAGFYEGEGTVQAHRHTYTPSAVQKTLWPLLKLKKLFRGSVYEYENTCAVWRIHGEYARDFAKAIYPFLSPRRKTQLVAAGFKAGDAK